MYNATFNELRTACKRQSCSMVRYVIRDNSELGYSLESEYFDFRNVDKCMLSIHIITHRPDFESFSSTKNGIKWMYDNVMSKILRHNPHR